MVYCCVRDLLCACVCVRVCVGVVCGVCVLCVVCWCVWYESLRTRRVCPGSCLNAPDYGGRVPVDTTPGPVPMHRAQKSRPLISASTARDAWPPAKPAVTCRCQAHQNPSGHTGHDAKLHGPAQEEESTA